MNTDNRRVVLAAAALAASLLLPGLSHSAEQGSDLYPTGYVFLDADDRPLPFQDRTEIVAMLRTAEIVEQRQMSRGVAGNLRVLLDHDGVRFKAVVRLIDVNEREETGSLRMVVKYRDSHIFELAAYELSELLGIGRVPPTARRGAAGFDGTIQIWMEGTTPEDIMLAEGRLQPPDRTSWWHQKSIMWVFDALIANTDRNQGNLLIDGDWNLWFIDHTRAFRETSVLFDSAHLDHCERRFWEVLQTTPDEAIRERLGPYLTGRELDSLLLRRGKLVKHFAKRIKKHGEDAVLFDLVPDSR
ncbi:MAG: hypothetical protein MUC56_00590 [Thermoanaerobaculales bacterium]|jgi:hypothetical protein|nr:hypothetical protein [Thermoanaerobaculales bacterium]